MQRLSSGFATTLSFLLMALPACTSESPAGKADATGAKSSDTAKPDGEPTPEQDAKLPAPEVGPTTAGPAATDGGAIAPADTGTAEAGTVEPPAAPDPAALLEQAANLDTDDAAATKALNDAVTAGVAKLDVAKLANTRGEALLTKGESERAEPFFVWARDAHNLFSEPVYNLAKLAAYAGDLEIAKEHLAELEKRGNKKLMKKVGVEPAFTPLLDDPDVRKLFEQ